MSIKLAIPADGQFQMSKVNDKTGAVSDTETVHASLVLKPEQVGVILGNVVKSTANIRDGFLSFLSMVYASPRLDGFRLSGDTATGKVSKEYKAAVRDAESDVVAALVASKALKLAGKDADQVKMQAFLSTLRDDKNYSNVKVTTNRYVAFVADNIVTASGHLVPVPFMQEQIKAVVDKPSTDTSVSGKLKAIEETELANMDAVDTIDTVAALKRMLAVAETLAVKYAEMATIARGNIAPTNTEGAAAIAESAIEQAKTVTPIGTRQKATA